MANWITHRNSLFSRLASLGPGPNRLISNPSGSVVISQAQFNAFSGVGQAQPYAVLGLCVGGGGRTRKVNHQVHMNDVWRPGRVGLALPGPAAEGFSPQMDMLAIAFDINDIPACHSGKIAIEELQSAANQLIDDELISALMLALLSDAESHGAASAFFDHGLSLILHRLVSRSKSFSHRRHDPLPGPSRLTAVFDLIEQRLDEDLRVEELARLADVDARTLTRIFKRQTGYTPFQYLTVQRMAHAKILLRSNMSVTETATAVGYANPAKFAAAFRRWIGLTPNEWKLSAKR
ncbi:MAG TPA: AraC family transcriptional regulator [Cellvibrio sp.]|nr:AraC family transcriptional regulator [Cellvibrio sp.]